MWIEHAQAWPTLETIEADIARSFDPPALAALAIRETQAKYVAQDQLRMRLERLRGLWPAFRRRLQAHLLSWNEIRDRLADAGCPARPEQIGISPRGFAKATCRPIISAADSPVLDLAAQTGLFDSLLERIFSTGGRWPPDAA